MRIIRFKKEYPGKIELNFKCETKNIGEDSLGYKVEVPSLVSWDGSFVKKNFKIKCPNEKIRLIIEDCYSGNIFITGHNKDTNQVFFVGTGRLKRHIGKPK